VGLCHVYRGHSTNLAELPGTQCGFVCRSLFMNTGLFCRSLFMNTGLFCRSLFVYIGVLCRIWRSSRGHSVVVYVGLFS